MGLTFEDVMPAYRPAVDGWHPQGFRSPGVHGEVQRSLARWLREAGWLVFTEIEIPSVRTRVDVIAIKPHVYAHRDIRAYEVKGHRADWNREMASMKWLGLQEHFNRVLFAFPAGVAKIDEVPKECGIAVQGEHGWHHVRNGRATPSGKLNVNDLLALLSRGYEEHGEARDLRLRLVRKDGEVDLQQQASRAGHEIGRRLAMKTPALDPELRALQASIEAAIGSVFRSGSDISHQNERIKHFLRALEEWERHGQILSEIGLYLSQLQRPWGDLGEAAGRLERALERTKE